MILTIAAVLFILWMLGLIGHVAGGFIHILIILALLSVIYHFLRGSRGTTV
jgi:hypothetical protein